MRLSLANENFYHREIRLRLGYLAILLRKKQLLLSFLLKLQQISDFGQVPEANRERKSELLRFWTALPFTVFLYFKPLPMGKNAKNSSTWPTAKITPVNLEPASL